MKVEMQVSIGAFIKDEWGVGKGSDLYERGDTVRG